MPNWIDVMVAQERYKDMARENEHAAQIAQIQTVPGRLSLWQRLTRWLAGGLRRTNPDQPALRVLDANGRALPITILCEPAQEETEHYLN